MAKKYDGWTVKYSWGGICEESFHPKRTGVVSWWDKHALSPSTMWKNQSRRLGHKIVKVKLVEVDNG